MSVVSTRKPPLIEGEIEDSPNLPAPDETVFRLRQAIRDGEHWFAALLDAVAHWRLPEETAGGRHYRYLIRGEAFDWLLLAERLLDDVRDLVPAKEAEALLWENRWPIELDDDEFALRLGPTKHSAHLNYLYGVLVEEALQLSVEEEIYKEVRSRAWGFDVRADETMYQRVYGKPKDELFALYYEATGTRLGGDVAYADWKSFTYWLFKLRLSRQDKARVASDTRKGLAQLTRMELAVSDRRHGARLNEDDFAARYSA
ncbi:MAG TPA: hypothetical protein PKD27_05325 [Tepidiformaceae bacterium]|nr:hypothetical protein [Tepidiformaceae bacterium]